MSLVLSRQREETIVFILEDGREIDVTVVDIRGDKVRLAISAAQTIIVHRKEVWEAIKQNDESGSQGKAETKGDVENPPLDKEPQ